MRIQKIDKVNSCCKNCSQKIIEQLDGLMYAVRSEQLKILRDCPFKLTQMEGTIMTFFFSNPGATLSDLVSYTARDKGQMARLIKNLRKHMLLEPIEDENDKRSVKLRLTDKGQEVNAVLQEELNSVAKIAMGDLSHDDQQHLEALLSKLLINLEDNSSQ